jgi:hypothetical protein
VRAAPVVALAPLSVKLESLSPLATISVVVRPRRRIVGSGFGIWLRPLKRSAEIGWKQILGYEASISMVEKARCDKKWKMEE